MTNVVDARQTAIRAKLAEFGIERVRFYCMPSGMTAIFLFDDVFATADAIDLVGDLAMDVIRPLGHSVSMHSCGGVCYDSAEKGATIVVSGLAAYRVFVEGSLFGEYSTWEETDAAFDEACSVAKPYEKVVAYSGDGRRLMWNDAEDADYQERLDRIRRFSRI